MTLIATKRLTLRPPTPDAIAKVVEWLNDPTVVRYSEQRHSKHSIESQWHYLTEMRNLNKYREIYHGKTLIGTITAYVNQHNDVANVGIMIGDKGVWGKGFGTEAWQAFCDHLLGNGVRKIEAGCMSINFGMINVFRKSGMRQEGTRYQHFLVGDNLVDEEQWARF